jgi:hypothetical protein
VEFIFCISLNLSRDNAPKRMPVLERVRTIALNLRSDVFSNLNISSCVSKFFLLFRNIPLYLLLVYCYDIIHFRKSFVKCNQIRKSSLEYTRNNETKPIGLLSLDSTQRPIGSHGRIAYLPT